MKLSQAVAEWYSDRMCGVSRHRTLRFLLVFALLLAPILHAAMAFDELPNTANVAAAVQTPSHETGDADGCDRCCGGSAANSACSLVCSSDAAMAATVAVAAVAGTERTIASAQVGEGRPLSPDPYPPRSLSL
jgi:hypothetical protein